MKDIQEIAAEKYAAGEVEHVATGPVRRCQQVKCDFLMRGGCKECDGCKAPSMEIREDCTRCYECENLPGALRWEDPQQEEMARQMMLKQKEEMQAKKMEVIR